MALEVRIYDNNLATPTLIHDVTDTMSDLVFSTQLNGGFKQCTFKVNMPVGEAWNWLSREGKRGYHFYRVTVHDEMILVWEGRIMNVGLEISGTQQGISVMAMGYWSSCHDQFYAQGTNWASGSNHFMHEIVADILTESCPDINDDQSGLEDGDVDLAGIVVNGDYPQKHINAVVKTSDTTHTPWFFAIWDDRKPYLFKRNITDIDWRVWLDSFTTLRLEQSAVELRNKVTPRAGTTDGTAVINAASQLLYPVRESKFSLPSGTPSASREDAATMFSAEQAVPRQRQGFSISGKVYRATSSDSGRLEESPKYLIRAGQSIRIQDLVPSSAPLELDDVRTFYIMETQYTANTDTIMIQPDRRRHRITSTILNNVDMTD